MFDPEETFIAILVATVVVLVILARWDVARRAANRASSTAREQDLNQ